METVNSVSGALEVISGSILDYALILAAVGTITMALLELIKGLTSYRQHFHSRMIANWIDRAVELDDPKAVLDELMIFAGGGEADKAVLFDQTSSKMMGQIQAAANITLDYPNIYPAMYEFFTSISYLKQHQEKQNDHVMEDRKVWLTYSMLASDSANEIDPEMTRWASQARARLGNLVSRRLDAFQNRLEYWWARTNQSIAIVSGSVLLLFILINSNMTSNPFLLVILSISGGLVSPFAKDVVSALTGLRTRRVP